MLYAVILAGGSGTRLWPRSREEMPKQFLNILGERTMLQEAVERILPLIPLERVFAITNREYAGIVAKQVPDLPASNIIGEIAGRGTAPAIGLAAVTLRRMDPSSIMAVLTADHLIANPGRLREAIGVAASVAERGYLVTLGIRAAYPETGYGYIQLGDVVDMIAGFQVHAVQRFAEKPDLETAQQFVDSGQYVWNSGMFIWRVSDILAELKRWMPVLYNQLEEIAGGLGAPEEQRLLERVWPQIEKQTIDYGVMERAQRVAVIPVDLGWSDIGSWAALLDVLPTDTDGNVVSGEHVLIDTKHTLVYSPGRLIAAIGLEEMVIVDTGDVTLICPKDRAQDVRLAVDQLILLGKEDLVKRRPGKP